jgi:hypothetical protein
MTGITSKQSARPLLFADATLIGHPCANKKENGQDLVCVIIMWVLPVFLEVYMGLLRNYIKRLGHQSY